MILSGEVSGCPACLPWSVVDDYARNIPVMAAAHYRTVECSSEEGRILDPQLAAMSIEMDSNASHT
jgi:hypothetical protein